MSVHLTSYKQSKHIIPERDTTMGLKTEAKLEEEINDLQISNTIESIKCQKTTTVNTQSEYLASCQSQQPLQPRYRKPTNPDQVSLNSLYHGNPYYGAVDHFTNLNPTFAYNSTPRTAHPINPHLLAYSNQPQIYQPTHLHRFPSNVYIICPI